MGIDMANNEGPKVMVLTYTIRIEHRAPILGGDVGRAIEECIQNSRMCQQINVDPYSIEFKTES